MIRLLCARERKIERKRTVGEACVEVVRDGIVELSVDGIDEFLLFGGGHLENRGNEGGRGRKGREEREVGRERGGHK